MRKFFANEFVMLGLIVLLAIIVLHREPEHAALFGSLFIGLIAVVTAVVIARLRYPEWFMLNDDEREADRIDRLADDEDDYADELDFRPPNQKEG